MADDPVLLGRLELFIQQAEEQFDVGTRSHGSCPSPGGTVDGYESASCQAFTQSV